MQSSGSLSSNAPVPPMVGSGTGQYAGSPSASPAVAQRFNGREAEYRPAATQESGVPGGGQLRTTGARRYGRLRQLCPTDESGDWAVTVTTQLVVAPTMTVPIPSAAEPTLVIGEVADRVTWLGMLNKLSVPPMTTPRAIWISRGLSRVDAMLRGSLTRSGPQSPLDTPSPLLKPVP